PEVLRKNNLAIDELCEEYDCKFFDYFSDRSFTFGDFNDNDHLNYKGAEKLSKMIDRDILSAYKLDSLR
ncbi:MAG: hypothetical protein WCL06_15135, partial [Bacteroidota bacterium]